MKHWLPALHRLLMSNTDAVRITVAAVRGSAPRDAGATMLVTRDAQLGTIGGGHLEFLAIGVAREMLAGGDAVRRDRLSLGAALGQCCGGAVDLWLERFSQRDVAFIEAAVQARARGERCVLLTRTRAAQIDARMLLTPSDPGYPALPAAIQAQDALALLIPASDGDTLHERLDTREQPLWIFGAGHVAAALVPMLAPLAFDITWIDSRDDVLPASLGDVRCVHEANPEEAVAAMPDGAFVLVMTHSHDQDFEICRALLARDAFAWAGLIGSESKRTRFRQRLEQRGIPRARFERIACPIGLPGLGGKLPGEIAIAVAAQLLHLAQAQAALHTTRDASAL